MLEWLTAKSILNLPRWGAGLLAIALILGAAAWLTGALDRHDAGQRDAGASAQRETDLTTTLQRTEQGNDARAQIRDPGSSARYDECLLSSRTPANCKRFLPERPDDHGGSGAGGGH